MNNNNIVRNREVLWGSEKPHTFFALRGIDKVYLLLYLHLQNVFVLFDRKNNLWRGCATHLFKTVTCTHLRPKYAIFLPKLGAHKNGTDLYPMSDKQAKKNNFMPKCPKSICVFWPKRLKNHIVWGCTPTGIIAYRREYPPGGGIIQS